ncbi:MAG TPA: hypothetical protein VFP05_02135 [Thermomicrobiales bacterium]|nr:hypothetical protein [Thermomicrobiales bacterium]
MLAYLLLAGRNGAPVDDGLIHRFGEDGPRALPFDPDERIVWRSADHSVVFLGWQAFTEVAGIGSHWAVDERGLTAFTGHCWPRETGWVHGTGRSWASQLRAWLGDAPSLPAVREALFGQFTIVTLDAAGAGWVAPDWAGAEQLFVAESDEITALSNRSSLCARAVTPAGAAPQRSLMGAGWLICEGWMLDEESGYWEVTRPPAGSAVRIQPGRGACVIEPERSPLLPPAGEPSATYEELLAEAEGDLRSTMRAVAALPVEDRLLSLSGGKDSRTLTALILSEGLQDRFRFSTHGSPERADAIAAKAVATRCGLDWSLQDMAARSPEDELENVLLHTWLTEGMTSAWGAFARPAFSPNLTVTGVAGEGLRWGPIASSGSGAASLDDVLAGLRKTSPIDPLRVLRPDARAYYLGFVADWVRRMIDDGIPLVSVPSIFKQEPLIHSRNGPVYTWSARLRINPYFAPSCLRSNHRLPVEQRPDLRFHLDLQRRCAPELSTMPFADSSWPEAAYRHLPDADDYRQVRPVFSLDANGRTWRQRRYPDYRRLIEPILLDRGNPIHGLLDYDRLVDRIETGDAHAGRTRHLWGVLTAAVWMGGLEQPIAFTRDAVSAR